MSELITKQAMKDMITNHWSDFSNEANYRTALACVDAVPPIQPKRGKWIHHPEIGWGETWLCDQCGEKTTSTVMGKPRWNFCPNCGCRMDGGE